MWRRTQPPAGKKGEDVTVRNGADLFRGWSDLRRMGRWPVPFKAAHFAQQRARGLVAVRCRSSLSWSSASNLRHGRAAKKNGRRNIKYVRKPDECGQAHALPPALDPLNEPELEFGGLCQSLLGQAALLALLPHVGRDVHEESLERQRSHLVVRTPDLSSE